VGVQITVRDLTMMVPAIDAGKAEFLIDGALALAYLSAPCLKDVEPGSDAAKAARMIILAAIARWATTGNSRGIQQQAGGPYTVTYGAYSGKFSDSEVRQLRAICRAVSGGGGAFAIDTAPGTHSVWPFDTTPLAQETRVPCEPMEYYGGVL
jgi:hypothetical protein